MALLPMTKNYLLDRLTEFLRKGDFTVEELFDKVQLGAQQIGYADLKSLLAEKVQDGTFAASNEPIPRYSLSLKR
jgi:hypothetical protein